MASVRQIEVNYPRDDIGREGSIISKGQGTRHFQKLNPDLTVVAVNKFKMNWETMEIECSFSVKNKYADSTVPKSQFLEIMETNSNLLRDLEAAVNTNNMLINEIEESEKQLLGYQKRIAELESDDCSADEERTEAAIVETLQDIDLSPQPLNNTMPEEHTEAASPVEEKTITDGGCGVCEGPSECTGCEGCDSQTLPEELDEFAKTQDGLDDMGETEETADGK